MLHILAMQHDCKEYVKPDILYEAFGQGEEEEALEYQHMHL